MPNQAPVLMKKKDGIGSTFLNREKYSNTFTPDNAALRNRHLNMLDADDDQRMIVLKASGKPFSTGISLDYTGKLLPGLCATDDSKEAPEDFSRKRNPVWKQK